MSLHDEREQMQRDLGFWRDEAHKAEERREPGRKPARALP